MIIYHHNDHDGRCAAAIVWQSDFKDQFPRRLKEVDYKDTIYLGEVAIGETVFILDFHFKPEAMRNLLKITSDVILIDHHETAFKDLEEFEPLRGYRMAEYSGCELTWMYVYPKCDMPEAVKLIGDYDKWALKMQPDCFKFYEGLKTVNTEPTAEIWSDLFEDAEGSMTDEILSKGETVIQYRDSYCTKLRESFGYVAVLEKLPHLRIYACNMFFFGSQGFGPLSNEYDIVAAYAHDGKKYQVSFYSDGKVHVGELCYQLFNGGGHSGAAGFVCKDLPFKPLEV